MSAQGDEATEINASGGWRQIIDECIAKALGNSFRQQILWILNERVASPSEIAKELGESLNKVCHHMKVLQDAGCIELAYERTIGNRIQHFYKATSRAFLEGTDWPNVPGTVKEGLRATLLQNVIHDAIEAVAKGTYDSSGGSHMSWTPMILDEQGCDEISEVLEGALLKVIAVQESTKDRLESSGATGLSYTVSILGYPSVGGKKKVGPPTDAKKLARSDESSTRKIGKAATKKSKGAKSP
jgi:DNA-binding transcriptional ArsR family regulator